MHSTYSIRYKFILGESKNMTFIAKSKTRMRAVVASATLIGTSILTTTVHAQAYPSKDKLPARNYSTLKVNWSPNPLTGKNWSQDGSADPTARVFGDALYVYTSTDKADKFGARTHCSRVPDLSFGRGFSGFCMPHYQIHRTTDARLGHGSWTKTSNHLKQQDVPWAMKTNEGFGASFSMWAPDVVKNGNTYYMLFPALASGGNQTIGVATASNPNGPFTARPQPLGNINHAFDPGLIKRNGQWFMFYAAQGTVQKTNEAGELLWKDASNRPTTTDTGRKYFEKSIWMSKIDANFTWVSNKIDLKLNPNKYLEGPHPYMVGNNLWLQYANGASPYGGYQVEQVRFWNANAPYHWFDGNSRSLQIAHLDKSGTNHGSIVSWKNKFWAFYHRHILNNDGNNWNLRRAHYSEVSIDLGNYPLGRGRVKPFKYGWWVNEPNLQQ